MLTDQTVTALLDAFASPSPTPGGGSVAALAGALGASLLAMVAGLPKTRTNTPDERAALEIAKTDLLRHRAQLLELVDRDSAAYDLVLAAYKRPKATDADKAARTAAIQDAMRHATEVPLDTMRACAEVVAAGKTVGLHGNPSAASDLGVGLHLVMAGLSGARLNVEVNLGSLTDAAVVEKIKEDVLVSVVGAGADFHAAMRAAGLSKGHHET